MLIFPIFSSLSYAYVLLYVMYPHCFSSPHTCHGHGAECQREFCKYRAITSLSVGSVKCASSFVSHTADDGQNDAAELLSSELPNEDASQQHSDICCVVKCCYCSLLWCWICFSEDIKRGIEGLTTSRVEWREKEGETIAHKATLLKIPRNDLATTPRRDFTSFPL